MGVLRVRLRRGADRPKLGELIAESPDARRILIEVETDDRVSAVERVRDFLLSNISRTVLVYARGEGEGGEVRRNNN